jgi:hypothetical protein
MNLVRNSKNYLKILLTCLILFLCINTYANDWKLGYDQSLLSDEKKELSMAFLAYGMALINWHGEHPKSKFPFEFSMEYEARKAMLDIWLELKNKKELPESVYLTELSLVYSKGFLKEYLWHFHKNEKWIQPKKLKMKDFEIFMQEKLPLHIPNSINEITVSQ